MVSKDAGSPSVAVATGVKLALMVPWEAVGTVISRVVPWLVTRTAAFQVDPFTQS